MAHLIHIKEKGYKLSKEIHWKADSSAGKIRGDSRGERGRGRSCIGYNMVTQHNMSKREELKI